MVINLKWNQKGIISILKSASLRFRWTTVDNTLTALIRLQPVSIEEIAQRIGLAKANLIAAMNNRRSLPEKAHEQLKPALGLNSAGALRTDLVHAWRVRAAPELGDVLLRLDAPIKIWQLRSPGALVTGDEIIALLASPANKPHESVMSILKFKRAAWVELSATQPDFIDRSIEISDPVSLWTSAVPRSAISFIVEQALKIPIPSEPTWEDIISLAQAKGLSRKTVWDWAMQAATPDPGTK